MVREKFIRTINSTIEQNVKFSASDFTVDQKKTSTRGIQTIVKIQFNYDDNYFMNINIPEKREFYKKNEYSDETVLDYSIECENCPGEIELIEKTNVRGSDGVVKHITNWLVLIWDELMSIPVNRELDELKKSVDDLFSQMKDVPNEHFSTLEQEDFKTKLDDLEKKFEENYKLQQLEKEDLESKLKTLHTEIDALKKTLKVFKKQNWFKSFGAKVMSWGAKPENQKMISNGAKIIKGFFGPNETPSL